MAKEIVSTFSQLGRMLPKAASEKEKARAEAAKHYMEKGGVLHLAPSAGDWPKMLYPSRASLKKKLAELRLLKEQYEKRMKGWEKKFGDAKIYHTVHNVKKLKEPLYWQHMARYTIDIDYRKDSDRVKLPAHLVADKRWKPMIKMFVMDMEYRKQLVQTVDESVAYRKNRKVAQYADLLQGFRMEQSGRMIEDLKKKIGAIEEDMAAMQELQKWASF